MGFTVNFITIRQEDADVMFLKQSEDPTTSSL